MAKISLKKAVKGRTPFNLNCTHATTTDFGQLQVSHILPVVPNDSIQCSIASEARFAPMVVPTFMDVKLVNRAFFVPMSAIWKPFEYFITDKQDSSVFKTLPTALNSLFASFFTQNDYSFDCTGTSLKPDFSYGSDDYILTEKGRLVSKLFDSLGYGINMSSSDITEFSLLPLLAFARICYDYIYPSQYVDSLAITKYFNITSSSDFADAFGTAAKIIAFLNSVADLLTVPYKQDYFTASWKYYNKPGYSGQNISVIVPEGGTDYVQSDQTSVRIQHSADDNLSQPGLNLLSRLYDFVTRNNIVGTRYVDQIFARFGIGSKRSDKDMSRFIGQFIQPINVADVTAMSAGNGQDLGDLAGKAYLQGRGNLYSFESADEYGFIITLSFVMPEIGYYQGRKRWTLWNNRFDFYTPEFDMQLRGIRNDEVFADFKTPSEFSAAANYGGTPANVFGFAPNYSELKKGDDYVTGDFRNNSLKENLKPYYLMRDVPTPCAETPLALNSSFLFMQQHEFDKIFAQVYVKRAPWNLRDYTALYGYELVTFDGKPLVLSSTYNGTTIYAILIVRNETLSLRWVDTNELGYLGVSFSDASSYFSVDNGVIPAGSPVEFSIAGYLFVPMNSLGDVKDTSTFADTTFTLLAVDLGNGSGSGYSNVLTFDSLTDLWRDYIDHVYLKHYFDVKATRSMRPISEEFMIQDGGEITSVDMNGNRIS